MPPAWPENASVLPSGDHETWLTAPMPGSLMRRSTFVDLRVENRDLVVAVGVDDERELARRPATSRPTS